MAASSVRDPDLNGFTETHFIQNFRMSVVSFNYNMQTFRFKNTGVCFGGGWMK